MKRIIIQATPFVCLIVCLQLLASRGMAQPIITTYAGGLLPVNGMQAITQDINQPVSVASDGARGFYFISADHRVYRVNANGVLTVIAGNGTTGFSGDGGPAAAAQFVDPRSIALDAAGNLFIADSGNNRIRKVTPDGIISTVAGSTFGFSGDGGLAISARLRSPNSVVVDGADNIFISDSLNYRVRKITSAGVISTVAGNGEYGLSGDGGAATFAGIGYTASVAVDAAGNLFIAEPFFNRIRKVTPDGIIRSFAGIGRPGFSGDGGPAVSAEIAYPRSIAADAAGNVFIADSNSNNIRMVSTGGIISTVAGSTGGFSGDGGPATSARLLSPGGIAVDADGSLFIADTSNHRVRKVTPEGIINTVAGNGAPSFGGDDGPAITAQLSNPSGVAVDRAGNVYIADTSNHRIRKVTPAWNISTIAGNGTSGFSGDGGPAVSAQLSYPVSVAVDTAGNVFISDSSNHIRKVDPLGVITRMANISTGTFCPNFYDGYDHGFYVPPALAVDAAGNLFVADSGNNRVRKVTPDGSISTVAGNGLYGYGGDGGPGASARLYCPGGIAVDAAGNLYVADLLNYRIRKIDPNGIISTVGNALWSGEEALSAQIALDPVGNLYVSDLVNNRILEMTRTGIIISVAGNGSGFSGDGGPAVSAQLYPNGIAVDAAGVIYIADTYNNRIRRIGPSLLPALTGVSPDVGAQTATVNVTITGTNLLDALIIDAGSGITVSNIRVVSDVLATATLTIDSNAVLGARSLRLTTIAGTTAAPFTVVPPFADLSITSSHVGILVAGFNGIYEVSIVNSGTASTTGALTVTDKLPLGMTFVSGTGTGWSCSALEQTVTCVNLDSLAVGASTALTLTVAIGGSTESHVIHSPGVSVAGDLSSSNDTASDSTNVASLNPVLHFESKLVAGRQSTVGLTLPFAFPVDVSGTLLLSFSSDTAIPTDDAAIQFASGGREVRFTIPANTLEARFGANLQAGPLGFQPGTVAGTLTFSGTMQAGEAQASYSDARTIPRQAPSIEKTTTDTRNGFTAVITLLSTMREVTELTMRFDVKQAVRLNCGGASGCTGAGSTLTFNVKSLFDTWYASGAALGSLSALRLPLSIQGTLEGIVWVTLRNSRGSSNSMSFPLP